MKKINFSKVWFFVLVFTALDIYSYSQVNWTIYNTSNSDLHDDSVSCIAIDSSNNVWFSSSTNGVVKFDQLTTWTLHTVANGALPFDDVTKIVVDNNDYKWISSTYVIFKNAWGLGMFNDTGFVSWNNDGPGLIEDLVFHNNDIYVGTKWYGYYQYDSGNFPNYTCNQFTYATGISAIDFDSNQDIWVSIQEYADLYVLNGGIAKFNGSTWTLYTPDNSMIPTRRINDVAVDTNDIVWSASSLGITNKDNSTWNLYNASNSDLPSDEVYCIAVDSYNTKWFGTNSGLVSFDGTNWVVYNISNSQLPGNIVNALKFDKNGNLWVACEDYGIAKLEFPNNINNNIQTNDIKIFPNPCNDIIYISIPENKKSDYQLNIYDIKGSLLLSDRYYYTSKIEIKCSRFPKGVNIIELIGKESIYINEIIIK